MGRLRSKSLTVKGWVRRSEDPLVRASICADEYLPVYWQLLADMKSAPRPLTFENAVGCLHTVYGWMPTIVDPTHVMSVVGDERDRLLEVLNAARRAVKPELTGMDASLIRRFANNSTVGASKLLHFLNPNVYPIWDSRVADRYLWSGISREAFNQDHRLMDYVGTLWSWSLNPLVQDACNALMSACPTISRASVIRVLELVMFHPPRLIPTRTASGARS